MRPSIRPMQEHDIDTFARLRCDEFFEATGKTVDDDAEGLRQLLLDGVFEIALVAEMGGVAVGSGLFIRNELEPMHDLTPWLAGLVVVPEYRGRGIGRDLVRAIETHARSVGCRELHLYTGDAEPFYASLGWDVADRFTQDGELMVLMSRGLVEEQRWPRSMA